MFAKYTLSGTQPLPWLISDGHSTPNPLRPLLALAYRTVASSYVKKKWWQQLAISKQPLAWLQTQVCCWNNLCAEQSNFILLKCCLNIPYIQTFLRGKSHYVREKFHLFSVRSISSSAYMALSRMCGVMYTGEKSSLWLLYDWTSFFLISSYLITMLRGQHLILV